MGTVRRAEHSPLVGTIVTDHLPSKAAAAAACGTGAARRPAHRRERNARESFMLDLNTGFGKFVVGQPLTPTDAVVSITPEGSRRGDQLALASRTLAGKAMRAALNSGPMTPLAGVRRGICR